MCCFTNNLSSVCLWKNFLKLVNIRQSYRQNGWLFYGAPFFLCFFPQRCRTRHISRITSVWRTETVTSCCFVDKQIHLTLLSTDITDWPTPDNVRHFAATSFSLLQQLCTVGHAIYNMADVNIFLLANEILLISSDKYFKTVFLSGDALVAFRYTYSLSIAIFWTLPGCLIR